MRKYGIEPLPSGHMIMEHVVKSVIGEGGFGIVYLAEHPKLHIRAAVKEFAPFKLAYRLNRVRWFLLKGRRRCMARSLIVSTRRPPSSAPFSTPTSSRYSTSGPTTTRPTC
jgi:hypothetical protein